VIQDHLDLSQKVVSKVNFGFNMIFLYLGLKKIMSKIRCFLFITILLITYACQTEKKQSNFIVSNKKYNPISLNGRAIKIDSLYTLGSMCVIDSILVIDDSKSEKPIHLFDLKNEKYIKSIGARGKGPGG